MGEDRPSARASDALAELVREALTIGFTLSPESKVAFEVYLDTLLLWRSRMALTAAKTPLAIVRYHILDSLSVAPFIKPGFRVADLGSGAGLPGIPIAIVCRQSAVVLIESQRKKANFLREVARRARLTNVEIVEERVEARAGHSHGPYDVTVCRAVWGLSEFLRISYQLLRSEGLAIAMKGPRTRPEAARRNTGFSAPEVVEYALHGERERVLLVFRKE